MTSDKRVGRPIGRPSQSSESYERTNGLTESFSPHTSHPETFVTRARIQTVWLSEANRRRYAPACELEQVRPSVAGGSGGGDGQ